MLLHDKCRKKDEALSIDPLYSGINKLGKRSYDQDTLCEALPSKLLLHGF